MNKRMLKLIPILLLLVSLTGCVWQTVSSADIKRAQHYCESSGSEVEQISAFVLGDVKVYCVNGTFAFDPVIKAKE